MQRLSSQDGRLREISSSTRERNQQARQQTDELAHLKHFITVLQEKIDKIMDLTGQLSNRLTSEVSKLQARNVNKRSRSKPARITRSGIPLHQTMQQAKVSEEFLTLQMDALEMKLLTNMTTIQETLSDYIQETINLVDSNLRNRIYQTELEDASPDIIKRLDALEDSQSYMLKIVQDIAMKQEDPEYQKQSTGDAPDYSYSSDDTDILKALDQSTEAMQRCKCTTPPEIGEAIIRNQLRMDVFQNDKAILTEELRIRMQEIASLTTEVSALKSERVKVHNVVGEYQRQVKHLMEVTDAAAIKVASIEEVIWQHDTSLKETSKIAQFTHQRLEKAHFRCTGGGKKYGAYCFILSKDNKAWLDAKQRCEKLGGMLAVIKDAETSLFITNLIRSSKHDTSYWIGLHDMHRENFFTWVDNTVLSNYTNWYRGEPTQEVENEDCVHTTGAMWNYKWNDMECDREFRYICQI